MAARPKLVCGEDELMEMQEKFRSGGITNSISSKVIKAPPKTNASIPGNESIFAKRREMVEKIKENTFHFQLPKVQVLKDVVEKCETVEIKVPEKKRENHFPEVFQRMKSMKASGSGSIFAQQLRKAKMMRDEVAELPSVILPSCLNQCSEIAKAVLGETEANKIHQENVQKLSSMTDKDILREQQQLLQTLDPKLIALLKNKKKYTSSSNQILVETPTVTEISKETEDEPEIGEIHEMKNSKWLHMNHMEKEKVRWMASLPPLKEIPGESFQARFDFQGRLLEANVDLPVTIALHHHGEEPERAGYSINELMLLSRSSKMQQRVLALNTLANILENTRLGIYDSCFEAPLIPVLLDNRFLMLVRFCLDDSAPSVVAAALVALSRLLSSPFDETCLERCFIWHLGEKQPNLCSRIQMDSTDQEQEAEMKDYEMSRVDVIKVCLRMDIPFRIRYIFEEIRPEAPAVIAAIEILTRMARHSSAVAQSIVDCPRLMDAIFQFFLPKDVTSLCTSQEQDRVNNVYGLPVRQVLRLARVIASWNAELATRLVVKYALLESIKIYVAIDTVQLNLPTQEALLLVLDSYYTWRTLLRQGVGIESFLEFYPVWFPQLQSYQSSISMDSGYSNSSNARFSHHLGSSLLLLMEALLSACCTSGCCAGSCLGDHKHLHIKQVGGLREAVEICVAKWTWQLRKITDPIPDSAGSLLATGIHLLATFYTHWIDPQAPSLLDKLCSSHILPLLHSEPMQELAKLLIQHSNLSSTLQSCSRFPESLPSVCATAMGGELVPIMASSNPFPLFTSIFRLLRIWKDKSASAQVVDLRIPNSCFDYLVNLTGPLSSLSGNWFTRYELQFLHEFLMICAEWGAFTPEQSRLAHQVALTAITSLGPGAEVIAVDWILHLIFQKDFILRGFDLDTSLEQLHLNETLLSITLNGLSHVGNFYSDQLLPEESRKHSRTVLTLEHRQILPTDWIYLPLVLLYQRDLEKPLEGNTNIVETALFSLRAVYVLLFLQPTWFFHVQPTEHYARLACTFLAGNDIFLDKTINDYMWPILRKLARQHLDFSRPVSGVDDFIDLYERLIDQFEAVSYGNPLFAAFLLLPLQQHQPVRFRLKLWCEHPNALRILTLNDQQMLHSLDHWKEPTETNEVLLIKYAASIRSGTITSQRNPVLFEIATHHITHYVERNPHALDKLNL
uniref:RNA polymerase II-associated protein n=1 Tax=Daphnia magna TaxID=35525 RepID=A0A0P5SL96_9CRUS